MIKQLGNADKVIYYVGFLVFKDRSKVVFDDAELEKFKNAICGIGFKQGNADKLFFPEDDNNENKFITKYFKIYEEISDNGSKDENSEVISKNFFNMKSIIEKANSNFDINRTIEEIISNTFVGLFYYHHRIILQFNFNNKHKKIIKDREERKFFSEFSRSLIRIIIKKLNEISGKEKDNEGKHIERFLGYFIKFQKNDIDFEKDPENLIGSETFKISEYVGEGIIYKLFGYEKSYEHYIRISTPGMNIYFDKKRSLQKNVYFIASIINAVYSRSLYPWLETFDQRDKEPTTQTNDQFVSIPLKETWEKIKEDFGGAPIDNQLRKISKIQYWALGFTFISLVISIYNFCSLFFKK